MKHFIVDENWLRKSGMCLSGIRWAKKQDTQDGHELTKRILKEGNINFACWALPHMLSVESNLRLLQYVLGDIDEETKQNLLETPEQALRIMVTTVLLTQEKNLQKALDNINFGVRLWEDEERRENNGKD